ncbi:MAG TPA: hypothetical protein VNZ65_11505, partial [Collimonas sp.]|nr:hypothetical protein [Collimonas sp.]
HFGFEVPCVVPSRSLGHALAPVIDLPVEIVKQSHHLTNCPNFLSHFFVSLGLDLLQYFAKAVVWGWVQRYIEKKFSTDTSKSYTVAPWLNWPALGLFWAKLSVMLVAYVLLFLFVLTRIDFGEGNPEYETLYHNSVIDHKARIHVSTFDSNNGAVTNKENCANAEDLLQMQQGTKIRFWCEAGRYKK